MRNLQFKCRACGKVTAGRMPRHGDGSFYYPRRHNLGNGEPCPGNIREADWLDVSGNNLSPAEGAGHEPIDD